MLILLPTLSVLGHQTVCTRMKVDGGSMLPTFTPGERFTTWHLTYRLRLPKRGEVIVLKRVIGLPGDEIYLAEGVVYVNGVAIPKTVDRETLDGVTWRTLESEQTPEDWPADGVPHIVPEGMLFVLGDHRDQSIDSRVFGDVLLDFVTGWVK